AAVRADVHERDDAARPRANPAARGRARRGRDPGAGRWADGLAPRAGRAVHRCGLHRRGRGAVAAAGARVGSAAARDRRRDELAARLPLYVPSLYATSVDAATGMIVVGAPLDPRVPARVSRAMVADLDRYPFPSDAPVPYAEAVFERASVEIARGCTEGCRFCQ